MPQEMTENEMLAKTYLKLFSDEAIQFFFFLKNKMSLFPFGRWQTF
jgi:hypothetical protein